MDVEISVVDVNEQLVPVEYPARHDAFARTGTLDKRPHRCLPPNGRAIGQRGNFDAPSGA